MRKNGAIQRKTDETMQHI